MSVGVTDGASKQLEILTEAHPEWQPYLSLLGIALESCADPEWQDVVVESADGRATSGPLLRGATVRVLVHTLAALLIRMSHSLADEGAGALLRHALEADPSLALRLVEQAAGNDPSSMKKFAGQIGTDVEQLAVVANLAAIPVLRAAAGRVERGEASAPAAGSCPCCGAWATLAESRGLERARWLRCGRCGEEWRVNALQCPFCGTSDHRKLQMLFIEGEHERRRVEACENCHGYVKTITTLRPWSHGEVLTGDLASVELDLVALDHGYARPSLPGVPLEMSLSRQEGEA